MNRLQLLLPLCIFALLCASNCCAQEVDLSVYLVTRRGNHSKKWLLDAVEQAVQGGVTIVQLDEPHLSTAEYIELGKKLHKRLAPYGVPLIINSRVDVTKAVGAEGVHFIKVPKEIIDAAREELGPKALIGLTIRDLDDFQDDENVDYFSLGPLFPSKTYPHLSPWGIEGLKKARRFCKKPLVVAGGIRHENAEEAIRAGADGVVVVAAILENSDPREAASKLQRKKNENSSL